MYWALNGLLILIGIVMPIVSKLFPEYIAFENAMFISWWSFLFAALTTKLKIDLKNFDWSRIKMPKIVIRKEVPVPIEQPPAPPKKEEPKDISELEPIEVEEEPYSEIDISKLIEDKRGED